MAIKARMATAALAALLGGTALPGFALAQTADGQVWIQIEARNTLAGAEDRVRHWAGLLPDVAGFALTSGWYGVVLGPYSQAEAPARLEELRLLGAIPSDSFIPDGRIFRGQFWPVGAPEVTAAPNAVPSVSVSPIPESGVVEERSPIETTPVTPAIPQETLAEARAGEAALSRDERMDIQRALQWSGTYASGIDGAFGPGSRAAISAWQALQGEEPSGVLTSAQRRVLVEGWQAEMTALGLETRRDEEAGIEADLPLGLVEFERYAPPFAQYGERDGSGTQIWLISQPGDQRALDGLQDLLAGLAIMPPGGPRARPGRSIEISGRDGEIETFASAELSGGAIRGWLVSARVGDTARTNRIIQALKTSFRPIGSQVLDPGLVPLDDASKAAMLTGIEKRLPERAGSGFYISGEGLVMTAASLVEDCAKVTLDAGLEARVVQRDAASGHAILQPATPLAPRRFAQFSASLPPQGSEISVAGFPFGAAVGLPAQTFGQFTATEAMPGNATRALVSLPAMAGDVGGAVLGPDGLVIGVLQERGGDSARALPPEVHDLAPVAAIAGASAAAGRVLALEAAGGGARVAEDLTAIGNALAVQVACWK